jgi:hypothetical protein
MSVTVNSKNIMRDFYASVDLFKARGYETGYIGVTELGNRIPYIKKGDGKYGASMIFGAIHAREHITVPIILKMAEEYTGLSAIYFVPVVNIDGVTLATLGIEAAGGARNLIKINGGSSDFRLWKANINAVDLNVNFDAEWGTGAQNLKRPAPANYIGPKPESESETKALVAFTKKHDFCVVLCYHCKGNVIYYGYKNKEPHRKLAELYSKSTGYPLLESAGSAGGYKDWFTLNYPGLSLTVEVGDESKSYYDEPDGLNNAFDTIWEQNSRVADITDYAARQIFNGNK